MPLPNVFEYNDYRRYLCDFYTAKKSARRSVSYNELSRRAGFKNKSFLHHVMHGRKNLSKSSVVKLSAALGHSKAEAEYFENLVFFNQAATLAEKNHFLSAMNAVKSRNGAAARARKMRLDQYAFYSTWYHSAIRSLIGMYPFNDNFELLGRMVYPPITKKQARRSVELLERLGLIEKQQNGVYRLTDAHITTGEEVLDTAALNYHRESARLAIAAMDSLPKDRRNITGLCMGISENAYQKIVNELAMLRRRLVEIVEEDTNCDRVYQLNLHLFPLSRTFPRNTHSIQPQRLQEAL